MTLFSPNLFRKIEILIVDDSAFDVEYLSDVLVNKCKVACNIQVAKDGEEAIKYFEKFGDYSDKPVPDLIFLDLNMPKVSGFEVLEWIKKSDKFKLIPVCIFTSSESEKDILRAYRERANYFLPKPANPDGIVNVLISIKNFWIAVE